MPLPRAFLAVVGSAALVASTLAVAGEPAVGAAAGLPAGGHHIAGRAAAAAAEKPGPARLAPPGYWLVASDGGIFAFSSPYDGSTGAMVLNRPIVGMAPTPDAGGYWLVASDGGIFAFGDAKFYGSTGNVVLNRPIVAMAPTPDGAGYWLVASDGGIFAFGDAPFLGSMGGHPLNRPIVGMAVDPVGDPYPSGTTGFDISWPQCNYAALPRPPFRIAIVGVNDGHPYSANPCFAQEVAWAGPALTVYVNAGPLAVGDPEALNGPAGSCASTDLLCQAYNWGWNAAQYSVGTAQGAGVTSSMWWLDIEMGNFWCGADPPTCSRAQFTQNDQDIQGMIDGLRARGISPGIYGTDLQFGLIAGSLYLPRVPLWVAGARNAADAPSHCSSAYWFAGGQAWLAQFPATLPDGNPIDSDYAC